MPELEKARQRIDEIDAEIAKCFEERLKVVGEIFEYKKKYGLDIYDKKREEEVIKKRTAAIKDERIKKYYADFLQSTMDISKKYQLELKNDLHISTKNTDYDIIVGNRLLENVEKYINLDRKIMIITDNNIPNCYITAVRNKCKQAVIYTMKAGEKSKSLDTFEQILSLMLDEKFTRQDAVVAIGGGVVGDVAGFCASCYMRGVDFYNIPTSFLAQIDSSVGGKTAVNLDGVKNIVGTFYQPKSVIIDTDTLLTLPKREFNSGMAEVIKMATTLDKDLFEYLEKDEFDVEYIIKSALKNKIEVVEKDEFEADFRRVLNFGHTIGHAIEMLSDYNHGESVAVGMLPMCSSKVKDRVEKLLKRFDLPIKCDIDADELLAVALNDKKSNSDGIVAVFVDEIGKFRFEKISEDRLKELICEVSK